MAIAPHEAALAAVHASAPNVDPTDWASIVALYDRLLHVAPSPVVALNRAVALAQRDGAPQGLAALAALARRERLARYPFYRAALGELHLRCGDDAAARAHFSAALALARNAVERHVLEKRLRACAPASSPERRRGGHSSSTRLFSRASAPSQRREICSR